MKESKFLMLPYIMTNSTGSGEQNAFFKLKSKVNDMSDTKQNKVFVNKKFIEFGINTNLDCNKETIRSPGPFNNKFINQKLYISNELPDHQSKNELENANQQRGPSKREVYFKLSGNLNISQLIENSKQSERKYSDCVNSAFDTKNKKFRYKSVDFINENFIFNDFLQTQQRDETVKNSSERSNIKKNLPIVSPILSRHESQKTLNILNSSIVNKGISNSNFSGIVTELPQNTHKIKGLSFDKQLDRDLIKSRRPSLKGAFEPNLVMVEHNMTKSLLDNCKNKYFNVR